MAAGATYEKIATTTLGSPSTTITFSSISSAYTDLRIVVSSTMTLASRFNYLTFNSDSSATYSFTYLMGNGTSGSSSGNANGNYMPVDDNQINGSSTTIPTFSTIDVFSYTGSTYKTLLNTVSADQNGSGAVINKVGLWRSNSAINSVTFTASGSTTFKVGTTATIYGIKAA
jgi:hypothetical protein